MESIVCLRSTLNINVPSKNPDQLLSFPHHTARHLAVVSHLSIPRSGPRLHHRVSCSFNVPPPPPRPPAPGTPEKDDVIDRKKVVAGWWKGPRAAAARAAVIVACALGAMCMSRGPPIAPFPVTHASLSPPTRRKTIVEKTRDEVFEILFKKKDRSADPETFPLIAILLDRRDYHEAKAVCEKIQKTAMAGESKDARPALLMAVINMMLAVEAMLLPNTTIEDVDKLIESAKSSWKEYRKLEAEGFVSEPRLTEQNVNLRSLNYFSYRI